MVTTISSDEVQQQNWHREFRHDKKGFRNYVSHSWQAHSKVTKNCSDFSYTLQGLKPIYRAHFLLRHWLPWPSHWSLSPHSCFLSFIHHLPPLQTGISTCTMKHSRKSASAIGHRKTPLSPETACFVFSGCLVINYPWIVIEGLKLNSTKFKQVISKKDILSFWSCSFQHHEVFRYCMCSSIFSIIYLKVSINLINTFHLDHVSENSICEVPASKTS